MLVQLLAIVALGAGSWLLRAGFIVFPQGRALAAQLDPWLAYARPAVLAALLASVSMRGTATEDVGAVAYALVLLAALTAAAVTRSLVYALVAGVLALLLLA